jgi:hypothetical protein
MRTTEEIISEIRDLVRTQGYIYVLCIILFEDLHFSLEKMHQTDSHSRLSINELGFLLGFLIQEEIDLTFPSAHQEFIALKKRTYELMSELQMSFHGDFFKKFDALGGGTKQLTPETFVAEVLSEGKEMVEPIFYAGTGAFDTQYLDRLDKKYKYDSRWLVNNKKFDISKIKLLLSEIKCLLETKVEIVTFISLKESGPSVVDDLKKKFPDEFLDLSFEESVSSLEIYQYRVLFFPPEQAKIAEELALQEFFSILTPAHWERFYKRLFDLSIVRVTDFKDQKTATNYFSSFSVRPGKNVNSTFSAVGHFNQINATPVIQINDEEYFVPIVFLLFSAAYEAPFYWMMNDKAYVNETSNSRGKVGEEMCFDMLSKIFGIKNTFSSIKISPAKGETTTDIDILCVLGNKALCVQVKSKKLTLLARSGDDTKLKEDFSKAVQEAYEQGLLVRSALLEKASKLIDSQGKIIHLSEEINDVYIMTVTTEPYPSLTHQVHTLLTKELNQPYPVALTIFDLELIAFYLTDPYDFLYYIRQRIALMDYYRANEEVDLLSFHLRKKLWKMGGMDFEFLGPSEGAMLARNYYPIRLGIEVDDSNDRIKHRWQNEGFQQICSAIKSLPSPRVVDLVFHLLDWAGDTTDNIIKFIVDTKNKTRSDGKSHNFSLQAAENGLEYGITYLSSETNDLRLIKEDLILRCRGKKYRSKVNTWIGLASTRDSQSIVNCVTFNNEPWKYDEYLERVCNVNRVKNGKNLVGQHIKIGKTTERNDPCHCGSRLKFKKCCGKL